MSQCSIRLRRLWVASASRRSHAAGTEMTRAVRIALLVLRLYLLAMLVLICLNFFGSSTDSGHASSPQPAAAHDRPWRAAARRRRGRGRWQRCQVGVGNMAFSFGMSVVSSC